LIAVSLLLPVN